MSFDVIIVWIILGILIFNFDESFKCLELKFIVWRYIGVDMNLIKC